MLAMLDVSPPHRSVVVDVGLLEALALAAGSLLPPRGECGRLEGLAQCLCSSYHHQVWAGEVQQALGHFDVFGAAYPAADLYRACAVGNVF